MVHSALKLRALAEDFNSFSSQSPVSLGDTFSSMTKTTSSSTLLNSTSSTLRPALFRPPAAPLLEMMTPQEFATVLRARVDRLISQWSTYASQSFSHGLPSPSSSGSPPLQQNGKRMDMSTIHAFVSFFYPEEHQIHHDADASPDSLLAHLGGLQTLLSFLSSKELRVIIRNRLTSSSASRSASIQAMIEVMRNVSVEEGENEESDLPWKQSWQKTSSTSDQAPVKTFVDVGVATEPLDILMTAVPVASAPVLRPSSPDGPRPPFKRAKYVPSHQLFQNPVDDFRTTQMSSSMGDAALDYAPGTTTSTIPPKMADPILRPVSTQSFKSSMHPVTIPVDEEGEADAEGDTDTDIDMDVDLAVDVDVRDDDSKNLTIAQVINSCRSEEAIVTNNSLSKQMIGPTLGSPSEPTAAVASMPAAPNDVTGVSIPSTRINEIPRGPRAMRGLLFNESTYSVPSSSGSRTPPIPNRLSRRTSPNTTCDPSNLQTAVQLLKTKQELCSDDWGLCAPMFATFKGNGTRHHPIEISEQTQSDPHVMEASSRRSVSIAFPAKPVPSSRRSSQGFARPPSPCSTIFTAPRGPPVPPTSSSLSSVLKPSTTTAALQCEGPELPPYDEVMASTVTAAPLQPDPDAIAISISPRSKPTKQNKKSPSRFSGRSSKSLSRSRSRSVDGKRHRLPKKSTARYDSQQPLPRISGNSKHSHTQPDKRAWDASSRSSFRSTSHSRSRSRSGSRPRVPYRPRNYSYSRPPSPSSAKDRHWSPEPNRRRERGRSRSRRRRGDENPSIGMDHWSPGRDRRINQTLR